MSDSLIFGERPEQFAHGRSFLVSNLSESLIVAHCCSFLVSELSELLTVTHFWWATWAICSHHSLKKRKWANHSFFSKNLQKKNILVKFCWANSFFCELKSKWAICSEKKSNLLIYHEQPEQIAHSHSFFISDLRNSLTSHGCSFGMSNLSDSLTVTHLSWLIWANCSQLLIWFEPSDSERMSNKRMSKFPTLRIGEDFEEKIFSP